MWNDDYKGRSTLNTGQIAYRFSENLTHDFIKALHFFVNSNEHDEQKVTKLLNILEVTIKRGSQRRCILETNFYQCVFDKREVRSLS